MRSYSSIPLALTLILACCLASCAGLPAGFATPAALPASPPAPTEPPLATWSPPAPSPTPSGPRILRLWLPPQFDPASDTPAGLLFKSRLDEFQKLNPGLTIETRHKALDGPGGLLDSLTASSAAAPQALPDLVILPRDLLETAALKGLLLPLDDLTEALDSPDWYPYASDLARLGDDIYGFPIAGDALVQAYRPAQASQPPADFQDLLEAGASLIFPAAGGQSAFTLAQYLAGGREPVDDQGRPYLDAAQLSQVLDFYLRAESSGVFSDTLLTQLQTEAQVWDAFVQGKADLAAVWSSTFLQNQAAGMSLAPLPTRNGDPSTLAAGWVWALAGRDQSKRKLAVELAEFLTESQFLAEWTPAAGYLPTRPSTSSQWPDVRLRQITDQIALSAHLLPPKDILSSLESPLQQAVLSVLNGTSDPGSAAQTAADSLIGP